MSRLATNWAWDLDIKPATLKLILLSMADRADEYHSCYPSNSRLEKDTGLNIKTVQTGILKLIEMGLIKDTGKRKGPTNSVRVFQLNIEIKEVKTSSPKNGSSTKIGVAISEPENGVGSSPEIGVDSSPEIGVQNLPTEPPIESISSSGGKADDFNDSEIKPNPYQQIIDKWNDSGFTKIRAIGGEREKLLKARIKEYSLELIIEAIEVASQSNFLKGGGDRGWVMDFTWFVKPNNFIKVLEGGRYVDRPQGGVYATNQSNHTDNSLVGRARAKAEASYQAMLDEEARSNR
ncbi:helix-turn-helix domain-containing protein [Wohlfahrtiimonas populi]|uniref:helix-turn-helix domain-containing protein n=1 Tax=Wohlfahrtiimonas populi TaxID=1940240 RepID=UPI00098D175D|nr:helix-turn-helix domain-containing protein [Wohlfahrtiimonas populi]